MGAIAVPVIPTNHHEQTIAGIVDRVSAESRLRLSAIEIDKIIAKVDFAMSRSECEFLVSYMRWRIDHPNSR